MPYLSRIRSALFGMLVLTASVTVQAASLTIESYIEWSYEICDWTEASNGCYSNVSNTPINWEGPDGHLIAHTEHSEAKYGSLHASATAYVYAGWISDYSAVFMPQPAWAMARTSFTDAITFFAEEDGYLELAVYSTVDDWPDPFPNGGGYNALTVAGTEYRLQPMLEYISVPFQRGVPIAISGVSQAGANDGDVMGPFGGDRVDSYLDIYKLTLKRNDGSVIPHWQYLTESRSAYNTTDGTLVPEPSTVVGAVVGLGLMIVARRRISSKRQPHLSAYVKHLRRHFTARRSDESASFYAASCNGGSLLLR